MWSTRLVCTPRRSPGRARLLVLTSGHGNPASRSSVSGGKLDNSATSRFSSRPGKWCWRTCDECARVCARCVDEECVRREERG
jgi:hypothetical protein